MLLTAPSCILDWNFEREVELRPGTGEFKYEVLLRGHFTGRGNPHDLFFDWSEKKWVQLYWIYVKGISSRVNAADLVMTRHWGCVAESEWQRYNDLKGYIEFRQETVTVALEVAQFDRITRALIGHKPFEGNGTYKMSGLLGEEFRPRDGNEAELIKYDSCKDRAPLPASKH